MTRVYVDMVGDLFHAGHVALLREARRHGDWLVVGLLSDETTASYKRRPVMTLAERVAVVEACRHVDEVVPDAPYRLTEEFLDGSSMPTGILRLVPPREQPFDDRADRPRVGSWGPPSTRGEAMTRQVVVTTIPVMPEHHENSRSELSTFVSRMRDVEGCLAFDVYESSATPGSFVTIAQWVDRATFEHHRSSPEVIAAMQAAQPLLSGRPTVDPLVPVDTVEP